MKRVFVVLFAVLVLGAIAGPAYASSTLGTGGYIEVCKAPNAALNGVFEFRITDTQGGYTVNLQQGTCTGPIAVKNGSVTVEEKGSSFGWTDAGAPTTNKEFLNTPTSVVFPGSATPVEGWARTETVPASTNSTTLTKFTFTNTLKTGVIEVCKAVTTPGPTGAWSFTVLGGNNETYQTSTTAGNCSAPITVPAGHFAVVENGVQSVTAITATKGAQLADKATAVYLSEVDPTIVATVDAGGSELQTTVTFTNTLVAFKLCKVWDGASDSAWASYAYPFKFVVSGAAGPNGQIADTTVKPGLARPGNCKDLGYFRAGTQVKVTEGVVPGTKVKSIDVNGSANRLAAITPNPDAVNRTVTVILGRGETIVTYTNQLASDGGLKICKKVAASEPAIPAGRKFDFTVTAKDGPQAGTVVSASIIAGGPTDPAQCVVVTQASKFNTTWTVKEVGQAATRVTSMTANIANVVVGGVASAAPVLTNASAVPGAIGAGGQVDVTISETITTEVLFVNVDPIVSPPVVVSSGGSSGGSGSPVVITPVAGLPALTPAAPAAPFVPAVVKTNTSASTNAAVQVSQLKKQLATLKTTQARLHKAFHAAKTKAAKNTLAKRIGINKAHQKQIINQLQLLS